MRKVGSRVIEGIFIKCFLFDSWWIKPLKRIASWIWGSWIWGKRLIEKIERNCERYCSCIVWVARCWLLWRVGMMGVWHVLYLHDCSACNIHMDGAMREVKLSILEIGTELLRDIKKWYTSIWVYAENAAMFSRCELDLRGIVESSAKVCNCVYIEEWE